MATPPTDAELRLAMLQAMEQMFFHSEANTKTLLSINAKLAGIEAGSNAIAEVVDENEANASTERQVAAAKEIISHLYDKSHQYVAVIIAGGFAAYFTMLAIMSDRFSDRELLLSALLITISLTIFVLWEVANIAYIGAQSLRGKLGRETEAPGWYRKAWALAIFGSIATALPAAAIAVWVYLRGLGVPEAIMRAFA